MKTILLLVALMASFRLSAQVKVGDDFFETLGRIESTTKRCPKGGDDMAVGDLKLRHKAYGRYQIRQPYVTDVNNRFGTKYRAEECLGNPELSRWIVVKYLEIYATERKLGRKPTLQDVVKIHNGGPNGWKPFDPNSSTKEQNLAKATEIYWRKFQAAQAKVLKISQSTTQHERQTK